MGGDENVGPRDSMRSQEAPRVSVSLNSVIAVPVFLANAPLAPRKNHISRAASYLTHGPVKSSQGKAGVAR